MMNVRPTWITIRIGSRISYKVDRRVPIIAAIILCVTLITLVLSISYGEYQIAPLDVVRTLLNVNTDHPDYANFKLVVHTFRLPRIALSFMVGAALALSGAVLQGITRNPLAEPGILGVSSGASLAAVAVIVSAQNVPVSWIPWAAFGGGLLTAGAVYGLAWQRGGTTPIRLILIGVALAAVLGAITSLLLVFGDIDNVQQAYIWLTGSVYGRGWDHVRALGGWLVILLPITILSARQLNTLALGEDVAKGLGMRIELQRGLLLVVSVALAAVSVAVAGGVGFVGLVAPHVTRRLVGPSHEGVLPISLLFGGALVVLADLVGRWIIAPSELPVGLVTAMIGAPYFLYLLIKGRNTL
jgi:iron complex transport system permease protein